MIRFLVKQHPLLEAQRQVRRLRESVEKLAAGLRRDHPQGHRILGDFWGRDSRLASLGSAIREEVDAWTRYGAVSIDGVNFISYCQAGFSRDLMELHRRLSSTGLEQAGDILGDILGDVRRDAQKLGRVIATLDRQLEAGDFPVVGRHTRYPDEFTLIKGAMAGLDQDAAKELGGEEVDDWCEWPGFNREDPEHPKRIARLILLDRESGQEYRLRHRLELPGRPLMERRCDGFPTPEDLDEYARSWGCPLTIYAAAAKPTWRIAWTFRREPGGWYYY